MRQNRRAKVYYATQVATNPPTIVLFTNGPELFDNTYQRFLLKTFRDQLPFSEVAIKLHLRAKQREDGPDRDDQEETAAPPRKKRSGAGAPVRTARKKGGQTESELWSDV
jgi:GTP-binding protein